MKNEEVTCKNGSNPDGSPTTHSAKIPNLSCTIFNNIFANIFFYQSVNKAATAVIFEY